MFVQIVVAEQDVALGVEFRVTPGTSGLLHVILQRVGNVVVNHHTHVLFIYSHAECGCCHDGSHLVVHEGVLVGDFAYAVFLGTFGMVPGKRIHTLDGRSFCLYLESHTPCGCLGGGGVRRAFEDGSCRCC